MAHLKVPRSFKILTPSLAAWVGVLLLSAPPVQAGQGPSPAACRAEIARETRQFRRAWQTAEGEREIRRGLQSDFHRFVQEYRRRQATVERRFLMGEITSDGFTSQLAEIRTAAGVTERRTGANRRQFEIRAEQPSEYQRRRYIEVSFCGTQGGARSCIVLHASRNAHPDGRGFTDAEVNGTNAGVNASGGIYASQESSGWEAEIDRQVALPLSVTDLDNRPYSYSSLEDYLYGGHSLLHLYCPVDQLPEGSAVRAYAAARAAPAVAEGDDSNGPPASAYVDGLTDAPGAKAPGAAPSR